MAEVPATSTYEVTMANRQKQLTEEDVRRIFSTELWAHLKRVLKIVGVIVGPVLIGVAVAIVLKLLGC